MFPQLEARRLHGGAAQLIDLRIQLLLPLDPPWSTLFIPVADLLLIGSCFHCLFSSL
jgi:hypothetical protein